MTMPLATLKLVLLDCTPEASEIAMIAPIKAKATPIAIKSTDSIILNINFLLLLVIMTVFALVE